jgi:general secretion pathway protein A
VYRHFFGLRDHPFSINPDPRYLFLTPQSRDAFYTLVFGIETRKGLVLLTGEIGTGKTTLIYRLLERLRQQRTPTAFLSNPHLETQHLFDFMLTEFGVSSPPRISSNSRIRLRDCLFERASKNSVLIVDEAQGLSLELLEEIRLLLNLETPREKLLQVVLVGQPEMEERLARHELCQLRQRIALRSKTAPLTYEETRAYVKARLGIAGSPEKEIFEPEAVDALHFHARGIQRLINLLAECSLINAYASNLQAVPAAIVHEAAREFQLSDVKRPARPVDFAGATSAESISVKSILSNMALSSPAAAAPTRGMSPPSLPFVVAGPTQLPNRESAGSSASGYGRMSVRRTFTEALRRETEQLMDGTELTSEDAFRLLSEFALKSQTIASVPTVHGAELNGDVPASAQPSSASHRESAAHLPTTEHETIETLMPSSKPPSRRLRIWQIRQRSWRAMYWSVFPSSARITQVAVDFCRSLKPVLNSVPAGFREMAAAVKRWLQQPWGQMPGALSARAIQARSRSIP